MYKTKDTLVKNTFSVEIVDEIHNEVTSISVFPPKIKSLKKLENAGTISEISEALAAILSDNKENTRITTEFIDSALDISELGKLIEDYFNWIAEIKKK
nr:MAG TPA: hypothetical protein [Caudoviricetes sp.]